MLKSIKTYLISLFSASLLLVPVLAPATVAAADLPANLCSGTNNLNVNSATSGGANTGSNISCSDPTAENKVQNILTLVLNIFSVVVGIIAVIMIIVGGFKYITSGGNDSNVASAKNTILYAVIGLIIVALAQIIVHFVLSKATNA